MKLLKASVNREFYKELMRVLHTASDMTLPPRLVHQINCSSWLRWALCFHYYQKTF